MRHGWGRHVTELNLTDFYNFNQILLPNTLTYLIVPGVTKMAILVVLFRINPSILYRSCVSAVILVIFVYTIALSVITGGPCSPLKEGTLTCLMNVALAHAVLNIASDLAVILLPIPTILSLQFSNKQKLTVSLILALGSGVVICSIARLPYVLQMSTDPDVTYVEAILGVWSIVEVNLGIICCAAMRLKPLLVRWLPQLSLFSSSYGPGGKSLTSGSGHGGMAKSWGGGSKNGELKTDPRKAQHTYQLHSVQKSSAGGKSSLSDDDSAPGIYVYREYDITLEAGGRSSKVHVVGRGSDGRGSTDKIHVPV